ncbi:MAG: UDP-galactopyranose mutase, partial [Nocardioidaceae bacterium]
VPDLVAELARRGLDVRGRVATRLDRSPDDQVRELGGSPYGTLWRGRATVDRTLTDLPHPHVYAAGVHAAAGSALPLVGLTAAVVAARVGPA